MCRWKSGARGCRRGRRANGRAGSSAPLRSACVMEKTLWGTRRKISSYASPASQSWARPAMDVGNESEGWDDGCAHPQTLSTAPGDPSVGNNRALPHAPPSPWAAGQRTPPFTKLGSPVGFCACRDQDPTSLPLGGED